MSDWQIAQAVEKKAKRLKRVRLFGVLSLTVAFFFWVLGEYGCDPVQAPGHMIDGNIWTFPILAIAAGTITCLIILLNPED